MMKFYRFLNVFFVIVCSVASLQALAQSARVTGKVTSSDDGSGLPGVSILEKGTSNGTVTDADGGYSINVGTDAVLVFSFVGYASQEVAVSGRTQIDITLETDVTALSEVVIVGYGELKKEDVTGSIVALNSKDFNKGVTASPQDLLLGKVAGVSITSNSGAPGSGATIRIRGGSSLNASNDPLIVIDGFPVDNNGLAGVANPLASINPNDIESYTVLKDASATAIYGSRASNGVIIITTKKGKQGKPKVEYDGLVSVSTPAKYLDVMDANEYRSLITELAAQGISGLNPALVETLGTENTDWQKEIYRNALSSNHNLSVSGSVKSIPYRVSYGYTNQEGILMNTQMERNSLNINLTPSFMDDHIKLNVSAKGSRIFNNFNDAGAVGNAVTFDPTRPVRDEVSPYGGYFSWLNSGATSGTGNPVAQLEQTDNKAIAHRLVGNAQLDYRVHFLPDLKLTVNAGIDRQESEGHNKAGLDAEFARNASGVVVGRNNSYSGMNESKLLEVYGNYAKEFGKHKVDFTGGYGWQHFYRESFATNRNGDNTSIVEIPPFKTENFLLSFYGRLVYSLNSKYVLTATLRNDGSSRFKDHWSLFPSFAFAWNMKEESFLRNVEQINDVKLRLGYGQTGQQAVFDDYPFLATYSQSTSTAQYQLGDQFYYTWRPEAYDPNIKWESTTTQNVGLDVSIIDSKLRISIDGYIRETKDLLNDVKITAGANFTNHILTNVGSLTNKGVEVSLNATPVSSKNLTWNAGFNLTYNKNEVTKLILYDDPGYIGLPGGNIGINANIQNTQVGYPANSFFVFKQVYDASGNPIEGLFVDQTGEGGSVISNEFNKYRFKNPAAKVLMGVNSRLDYKKFDFSFSGRISLGNYVYNNTESSLAFYNNAYSLSHFRNMPKSISDTHFIDRQAYSDFYVQDASFFKMDNISLGYNVDKLLTQKLKARFSLTVQNAFVITKYKGIDPEVDGGLDNNIYPRPRVFLAGINLSF